MLLVNNGDGFTITVSENQQLARIAKRTVLSESAFSILLPVLNRLFLLTPSELRDLFSRQPLGARAYRSPNGECRQSA